MAGRIGNSLALPEFVYEIVRGVTFPYHRRLPRQQVHSPSLRLLSPAVRVLLTLLSSCVILMISIFSSLYTSSEEVTSIHPPHHL